MDVWRLWGGQRKDERMSTLKLLHPNTTNPSRPGVLVGTPHSGALGIDLTAAHLMINASNDLKLGVRLQARARIDRPPQRFQCTFFDVIATGPSGEKTVEPLIVERLKKKEDLATWTVGAWVQALKDLG